MMNANPVGEPSLRQRYDRPSHDRHDQDSGTIAGKRAKLRHSQRENAGEHDRVEKSHQDDAPHGYVAAAHHGGRDQYACGYGTDPEQYSRIRRGFASA